MTTEEPKVEEPVVEEPKVDEPVVDEPKTEEPKTEEPKVEEPKVDEPKVDEPKVDEPKVDEPKVDEPEEQIDWEAKFNELQTKFNEAQTRLDERLTADNQIIIDEYKGIVNQIQSVQEGEFLYKRLNSLKDKFQETEDMDEIKQRLETYNLMKGAGMFELPPVPEEIKAPQPGKIRTYKSPHRRAAELQK